MSTQELQSLKKFKIWNEFGKIEFLIPSNQEGIDLTGVDLFRDVEIK